MKVNCVARNHCLQLIWFLKYSFTTMYRLQHLKLNIYVWKTKFLSHKRYLCSFSLSENGKRLMQIKIYFNFSYSSEKTSPSVCMLLVYFASIMFLIPRQNLGRIFQKINQYSQIFLTTIFVLSLKQMFENKAIFHIISQ